jgi:RHS repeat-associated protein
MKVDLNGDGKSDLIFENEDGSVVAYLINGTAVTASAAFMVAGSGWRLTHVADLNGDGKSDLIWRHTTTGQVYVWLMDGLTGISGTSILNDVNWVVTHVGDFNGDGKADLLWRNINDGTSVIWLMDGATVISAPVLMGAGSWIVTHTADFNGDGKSDILWRNTADGSVAMWLMNGTTSIGGGTLLGASPWFVTHTGDFNGDGKADLIWRNSNDGSHAIWLMNGSTMIVGGGVLAGTPWVVSRVTDFDGDGKADILWRHSIDGSAAIWLMNGTSQITSRTIIGAGPYVPTHVADFDGNGKADILWRNMADGSIYTWLMDGTASVLGGAVVGAGQWRTLPGSPNYSPPVVKLIAPTISQTFNASANITFRASAQDLEGDVPVRVRFFNGSTALGTELNIPNEGADYKFEWTGVAAGNYTVRVRASDATGAYADKTANITVAAYTPPVIKSVCTANTAGVNGISCQTTGNVTCNAVGTKIQCKYNGFSPTSTSTCQIASGAISCIGDAPFSACTNLGGAAGYSCVPTVKAVAAPADAGFGSTLIGATSTVNIGISNSGVSDIQLTNFALNMQQVVILENQCPTFLQVGKSCNVKLGFTPASIGYVTGTFGVATNSGTSTLTQLSGSGVNAPTSLSVSTTSLNFGAQAFGTTTSSQVVTLTNTSSSPVTVSNVATGGFDYTVNSNTCTTLSPGATCQVGVTFTPYAAGTRTAALAVSTTLGGELTVPVNGGGKPGLTYLGLNIEDKNLDTGMNNGKVCILNVETGKCDPTPITWGCRSCDDDDDDDGSVGTSGGSIFQRVTRLDRIVVIGGKPEKPEEKDPCADGGGGGGGGDSGGGGGITNPNPEQEAGISSLPPINDIGKNAPADHPVLSGDPINTALGNKTHEQIDYVSASGYPLEFYRNYVSMAPQSSAYAKQYIGAGWYSNWDQSVNFDGVTARVVAGAGVSYVYTLATDGVSFQTTPDIKAKLERLYQSTQSGNVWVGWKLGLNNEFQYYNTLGQLTAVLLKGGQTYSLAYSSGTISRLASVTAPGGRKISFSYDAQGRMTTLGDPASGIVTYFYDAKSRLTAVEYPDGRKRQYEHPTFAFLMTSIVNEAGQTYATFTYDAQGRATKSEFAGAVGTAAVTYNADGSATVQDATGATVNRTFQVNQGSASTKAVTIACPACGPNNSVSDSMLYDANNNLTKHTNKAGIETTYTYNARNLVTSRTEASGTAAARTVSYQWHPTFNLPTQVIEPTKTTTYTYDTAARVVQTDVTANGVTRTTSRVYNAQGLLQSEKGPRTDVNDTTTYTYDTAGNVATVTNPKGQVTTYSSYDMHGNILSMTYPNGVIQTATYDPRSRMLSKTVEGATTNYTYDLNGQTSTVTNANGSVTTFLYDSAQRLIGKDLNNGEKLRYTLDSAGRTIKTQTFDAQNILSSTTTAEYDGLNRVTKRIDANNKITSYAYDANGNVTATTDANGLTTTSAYDPLNRVILVTDPLSKTTAFTYNPMDQILSVRDPNNNTTAYTYNGFGDNLSVQSPDTGTTTQSHNAAGMVVTKTDARGKTATYQYDVIGRITSVAYADGGITTTYDVAANGVGKLASVTDYSGSTSYTYDGYGRTASKTTTVNGADGQANVTKTMSYGRDSIGRLTSMTYPSGKVLTMAYAQGRVVSMTWDNAPLITGVQYLPFGGPESWLYNRSGINKEYTRYVDLNGRIEKYLTPLGHQKLTFDNASRITAIEKSDRLNGGTVPTMIQSHAFAYDNAGRLTSFAESTLGGSTWSTTANQSFTYDSNGNRTSATLNGSVSNYSYLSGSNRLAGVITTGGGLYLANSFDASGNLISDGTNNYTYDARGRLTKAQASGITTGYKINYENLRVRKGNTNAANTRVFMYDSSGHMMGEYDASGNAVQEMVWLGDTPVAVTGTLPCTTGVANCTEQATAMIWTDHLNTPRELTRVNAAGQHVSIWKWSGLPFGETVPNENPSALGVMTFNHRFPGQYFDKESGLNQNWHRDYDPRLGRYVQTDPQGLKDGTNIYAYVHGMPVGSTDHTGLYWEYCSGAGRMYHINNDTGARTFIGSGFAGNGDGINNVAMQCKSNVGPLPTGTYNMQNVATPEYGANGIRLKPNDPKQMCGRAGFWIHAGQNASDGCIDLSNADALARIASGVRGGDTELRVIGTCQ